MSRPGFLGRLILGAAALVLLAGGYLVFFLLWTYPVFGLGDLPRSGHQEAVARVAKGFADSKGWVMEGFDFLKVREIEGADVFVWGAALMRPASTAPGARQDRNVVWVYVNWNSTFERWMRVDAQILAEADNEMFYSAGRPSQFDRARLAVTKIWDELKRRVLEVWGLPG